ncbi:Probable CoA ligase CCL5 [Linum grandiflorum]
MAHQIHSKPAAGVDRNSGLCKSTAVFYSKRDPTPLPPSDSLDVATFIAAHAHSGKTAFIDAATGTQLTYLQFWRAVDSVSARLSDLGLRKGHVVLLLSPNTILFPIVTLSVISLGAVITTVNPLNTPNDIAKQIADSSPFLAFTTRQLVAKLDAVNFPVILMDDDGGHGFQSHSHSHLPANVEIVTTLTQMIKHKPSDPIVNRTVRERISQNDVATLLYSSGTTGASKGVLSSHGSLIAVVQNVVRRHRLATAERKTKDPLTFLCTIPMFHIYGMTMFTMGLLAAGATIVILSKYEIGDMLLAIEKFGVTDLPLVPPILVAMTKGADHINSEFDLGALKCVLCGGSPLSKEVAESFEDKYPTVKVSQAYGMTESPWIASMDTAEECRQQPGAVGMLLPNMEAMIVAPESGEALGVNEIGELWLRGPYIMKGYLNNKEATSSTIDPKGWLKTGDICYINDHGFLFVVDRLKELIKYKGYQVAPAELEALLLTHPQVDDAAVIPMPHKEVGQYPMAYVVRKSGSNLSATDIIEFVASEVAPYKKVREVKFIAAIPKNPSGKILRKDLIKLATSTGSSSRL